MKSISTKNNLLIHSTAEGPRLSGGGGTFPPTFGHGGHSIFWTPQQVVIKNNVVVQISWLHYCWKRFSNIKPGNK